MINQHCRCIAFLQLGQKIVFQAKHNQKQKTKQYNRIGRHLNQLLRTLLTFSR